jgi:hypothetical protein
MATPPPVGIDARYYARVESTYDTVAAFVGGDAVPLLDLVITPTHEYHRSKEHLGTASLVDEIKGMSGGTWSATAYVKPNAAGVAPDIGEILKAAMGAETIVASTSVTYSLNSANPSTLQLARQIGTTLYEVITGAWIESIEISVAGNEEPTISVSGGFATYGWVFGGAVSTATITALDTTFTLATAHRGKIGVNGRIQIGTDNNAGAGYLVTAYAPSTGLVTFSPALGVTQTGATAIVPFGPTPTLGGFIVGGISCGLSLDGGTTQIGVISAKVAIQTGFRGLASEATTNKPTFAARGLREVSVDLEAYFRDTENAIYVGKALDGLVSGSFAADANMILRLGENVAAKRMIINAPKARIDVSPLSIPESEETTAAIKLMPRKNAANDDEITIVFS